MQKSYLGPQIRQRSLYERHVLAKSDWFAGDTLSPTDIQMSFPLEATQARGFIDARQPRLQAWLQAIHARPAYQRALAQGGPYSPYCAEHGDNRTAARARPATAGDNGGRGAELLPP
ncbi:glutathione binding-like protein [Vogesella indigofera]|uniref:glutathione binding-like protein n=1 Tax=Vogesella indigofera TaxID=45465 RepID=UPI00234F1C59|nr:glutathione binding-like protein [Vogesella indigofera]MDC7706933.1 glutathione binding-like protein [Vogesella indigofera]